MSFPIILTVICFILVVGFFIYAGYLYNIAQRMDFKVFEIIYTSLALIGVVLSFLTIILRAIVI